MASIPTLYHVPRTISSPIYQVLIELGQVSNANINVEVLSFQDIKTPEYLSNINPMGTSPAFVHKDHPVEGDIKMFESGAIMSWLLEEYDTSYKYHPAPTMRGRSTFIFLQQYIIATVYPFLASLFLHALRPTKDQDANYIEEGKEKFKSLLGPTLESFLSDNSGEEESAYVLGGSEPSAIDFLLAKPLGNAASLGLLDGFDVLKKNLQLIQARPSYCEAYGEICAAPETAKASTCTASGETRTLVLVPSM